MTPDPKQDAAYRHYLSHHTEVPAPLFGTGMEKEAYLDTLRALPRRRRHVYGPVPRLHFLT